MTRLFSVHRDRIGRSPGTVEYLGRRKVDDVAVHARVYGPDRIEDLDIETVLDGAGPREGETLWVDVLGLHDTLLVTRLGERFGIDSLVLEDVLSTTQRAKVEERENVFYAVCRSSIFTEDDGRAQTEQVSIVLGDDFVVSFQEREPDERDGRDRADGDPLPAEILEHRLSPRVLVSRPSTLPTDRPSGGGAHPRRPMGRGLHRGRGRLRSSGAGYLAYALLDAVVDGHLLALAQFGERVEALEEDMIDELATGHLGDVHALKRELVLLRRAIRPMREMTLNFDRLVGEAFGETVRPFLGDLHDHTIQAGEALDAYNDLLRDMHDFYQSTVGQRLNEVMKVLTMISTLFVPLTFVAGIYGMNFEHMPELGWRWSYPLVWVLFAGVVVTMLTFFRRKRWL